MPPSKKKAPRQRPIRSAPVTAALDIKDDRLVVELHGGPGDKVISTLGRALVSGEDHDGAIEGARRALAVLGLPERHAP